MLIKALSEYYDMLAQKGKVLPAGYSKVKIHKMVCLNESGEICEIIDWRLEKRIKKRTKKPDEDAFKVIKIPKEVEMPKRTEKSGIDANIIEHRPLYLFGLNYIKGEGEEEDTFSPKDATSKAKKSHDAFVKTNLEFLEGIDSPVANAYRAFIEKWKPEEECDNVWLKALGKEYAASYYSFCLNGSPERPLEKDPQVRKKWEERIRATEEEKDICSISGEYGPIARIHEKIKGVAGGQTSGNVLVVFNNPSDSSYGKKQSYNSGISETVMKKYVEALNYLLNGNEDRKPQKVTLDDLTITWWAEDAETKAEDFFAAMSFKGWRDKKNAEDTQTLLGKILFNAKEGKNNWDKSRIKNEIEGNVTFYILGLKPTSSRLSVKFLYRNKLGEIIENILKHQQDMRIGKETAKLISLEEIVNEMISPKLSEKESVKAEPRQTNKPITGGKKESAKVDPELITQIMNAIIFGRPYPAFLLETMVNRVKKDTDTEVNAVRAGIIKACVNRKARVSGKKEEIDMALNKENTNQAYLCGRLFAVLELLQKDASDTDLNRTIKDSYFSSAASRPALVFPKLICLSQNHMKKVMDKNKSFAIYKDKLMGEIMDKLEGGFPKVLSVEEQGKFILGYFQQRQDIFTKKDKGEDTEENKSKE